MLIKAVVRRRNRREKRELRIMMILTRMMPWLNGKLRKWQIMCRKRGLTEIRTVPE